MMTEPAALATTELLRFSDAAVASGYQPLDESDSYNNDGGYLPRRRLGQLGGGRMIPCRRTSSNIIQLTSVHARFSLDSVASSITCGDFDEEDQFGDDEEEFDNDDDKELLISDLLVVSNEQKRGSQFNSLNDSMPTLPLRRDSSHVRHDKVPQMPGRRTSTISCEAAKRSSTARSSGNNPKSFAVDCCDDDTTRRIMATMACVL
ncbi:hypothetical protein SEMRO_1073_G238150.1 [Seminavis robusta]|uniref:Uncharacterized protein n=1 Tax=Seminavis robusta TaxID=568900 RepID=A0A9N8EJ74_9STRA|nr:hypothetical protein SEMRO_1073_G238150.1 [Seminavis robusta]|eukprot:Sro1073_g238150.1 n/a (205) ;mRNA; r:1019-1633